MPKSVHLRERYTQEWVDKLVAPEFPRPFQPFMEGPPPPTFGRLRASLPKNPIPCERSSPRGPSPR